MCIFSSTNELIQKANEFVDNKTNRLERIVNLCLSEIPERKGEFATFPAILYCFATIDLFVGLYSGKTTRQNRITAKDTKEYMHNFMNYKPEVCDLLMNQFRHKIAHLSDPQAIVELDGKYIGWRYIHEVSPEHLQIKKLEKEYIEQITPNLIIKANYVFILSIQSFVDDIKKSKINYLKTLESDFTFQQNFEKAFRGIYSYQ